MFRFKKDLKTGNIFFIGFKRARSLNYLGERYFYSKVEENLTKEETLAYIEDDNYHHDIDEILERQGYSGYEIIMLQSSGEYDKLLYRDESFLNNFDIYDKISDFSFDWYINSPMLSFRCCKNKIDGKYYIPKSIRREKYADKFK